MGILCVFCVYDTIGNRCFEKTSFPETTTGRQVFSQVNKYTLYMEMSMGVSLLRTAQSLLTGRTINTLMFNI